MKIPVIIDTDIGSDIDDTWAIVMALGCPELDIKMVVSCTGDTTYRAKIICKLLEKVGRSDIPVGVGLPFKSAMETQGAYVEDYDLADYPGVVHHDGVAAMADTIMQSAERVSLICIGPLPNIAELLKRTPDVTRACRFIGMHGAIYKGYLGNDEIQAEYNVVQNLPATKSVFASDLDITITPLDSCGMIRLLDERYQRLLGVSSISIDELMDNYRIWLETIGKSPDIATSKSSTLFDTVAIYLAFSEELLEMQQLKVAVDADGKTIINEQGKAMNVATGWKDLEAFYDLLVSRLISAP
jgi:inosine-uridine nucleoside N-ribohydrolase